MTTILQKLKDAVFEQYPRQDDPAPYGREWGDEGAPLDQTIDDAMAGKPSKLAAYDRTVIIDEAFKVIEAELKNNLFADFTWEEAGEPVKWKEIISAFNNKLAGRKLTEVGHWVDQ